MKGEVILIWLKLLKRKEEEKRQRTTATEK
jgi:hypothetical protein